MLFVCVRLDLFFVQKEFVINIVLFKLHVDKNLTLLSHLKALLFEIIFTVLAS